MKLKQTTAILIFLLFSCLNIYAQEETTLVKLKDQVPSFTFEVKTRDITKHFRI